MQLRILGDGPLGRAVATAAAERGDDVRLLGRPAARMHDPALFVGAGCLLLEGVLVGAGAVLGAGVVLTGTSRLHDLVEERVIAGTPEAPLAVPPGAVVVPGVRPAGGAFAAEHGLGLATAVIVKRRDAGTSARVALEDALR